MRKEQDFLREKEAGNDRIRILTELIWQNWKLLFYRFDERRTLLSWPESVEESEKIASEELMDEVIERFAGKKEAERQKPFIYMEEEGRIFYWMFLWEKTYYLLGVMHAQPLTFSGERGYLYHKKIKRKDFSLRECNVAESFPIISLIYFYITGNTFDLETLLDESIVDWQQFQEELVSRRIDWTREDRTHMPYQYERKWYQSIRDGREHFRTGEEESSLLGRVGVLAREDEQKQMEYMDVAQITLAARAAIEGGVPPLQAYQMSDLFLQKCAACSDMVELLQIGNQASNSFARLVREHRNKNTREPHVELCKDYIARHLTKKFSIAQMAEELGISYSYLASKFREMEGISLKKYLTQEKLRAAANLLKYSKADVGEIAEYLAFPSASSMCVSFREQYGDTPLEFRKKNQVIDFISE